MSITVRLTIKTSNQQVVIDEGRALVFGKRPVAGVLEWYNQNNKDNNVNVLQISELQDLYSKDRDQARLHLKGESALCWLHKYKGHLANALSYQNFTLIWSLVEPKLNNLLFSDNRSDLWDYECLSCIPYFELTIEVF